MKNVDVEATLWQKLPSALIRKRIVDRVKLRRENNVFNLTNISFSDAGPYYCVVCGTRKPVGGFRIITGMQDFKAIFYSGIPEWKKVTFCGLR